MKEYLKKLIERKMKELKNKEERMKNSEDINEVRALGETLIALRDEINDAEEQLKKLDEDKDDKNNGGDNGNDDDKGNEGRSEKFDPNNIFEVVGNVNMNQRGKVNENEDPLSSMEYRKAFKTYAQTGKRSDTLNKILSNYKMERRDAGQVTSDELGVLIPHTVLQELIKNIEKDFGKFSSRVRMLNIQGGVEVAISDLEATFSWSGSNGTDKENGVSTEQDAGGSKAKVSFSYNIGEVRIAQSLLNSILSVDLFENELMNALLKAFLKARDIAVLKGTGDGQPTGILSNTAAGLQRIPADHIISFTEDEISDWTQWNKKFFSEIPVGMEGEHPEFAMAKQTYVSNLETMTDKNNQPINKAGFDVNEKEHKFNEYPVLRTEQDLFKSYDKCSNGEIFGIFWVPEKAYAINSNMAFGYKKYFDDKENKWVSKGLVIMDGKPLNTDYIYLLKKEVKA